MLIPRSPSPVTRSISVSSPSALISALQAAWMACFIFLPLSDCASLPISELTFALDSVAICASGLPGCCFTTLGHAGAVVAASSQRSHSSFTPRTEIEIPAISSDERNAIASSISVVAPDCSPSLPHAFRRQTVARHAMPFLENKGFAVERIYAGTYARDHANLAGEARKSRSRASDQLAVSFPPDCRSPSSSLTERQAISLAETLLLHP